MKKSLALATLVLMPLLTLPGAKAQIAMKLESGEGKQVHVLNELAAVLVSDGDSVRVEAVLPEEIRPAGYKDIKIKKGDLVLMFNAKRVKTIDAFLEIYNGLKAGEEVKLGLKRAQEMFLLSFEKVDESKLKAGPGVMMIQSGPAESGGGHAGEDGVKIERMVLKGSGGAGDPMRPLLGTGLILAENAGEVIISRTLEGMTRALGDQDIQAADSIRSLNGEEVVSLKQFFEAYEKIEIGAKVTLELHRHDKQVKAVFPKPAAKRPVIMQ